MINQNYTERKMLYLVLAINIIAPLYYLYLHLNPQQGFFGSAITFMYFLLFFPIFIFLLSFMFRSLVKKIQFGILSFVSVYFLLIYELIKTEFDSVIISLLFIYLIFPFGAALISYSLYALYKKFRGHK